MEFVIRLLVFGDLVSFFFFFVTFFQLPQSLHSCTQLQLLKHLKPQRAGVQEFLQTGAMLFEGGGGVELTASWFDYLENATRGVFFFF